MKNTQVRTVALKIDSATTLIKPTCNRFFQCIIMFRAPQNGLSTLLTLDALIFKVNATKSLKIKSATTSIGFFNKTSSLGFSRHATHDAMDLEA
jgi:hypothetical protein